MLLYLIAFLEWYTTLSVEIIAIRNAIPIIGNNAISTSIILGVILVALSYGYYRWWAYASYHPPEKIIRRLFINLFLSSVLYTFVSFPLQNTLLTKLFDAWTWYSISIFVAILLLFALPVYLASQTLPLLSELISSDKKWETMGRLLFYSTVGSFLGSLITSIVFFPLIWVVKSIILNWLILAVLSLFVLFIYKKYFKEIYFFSIFSYIWLLLFLWFFIDLIFIKENIIYSHQSTHSNIEIMDIDDDRRLFMINWSFSSGIYRDTGKSFFNYINETTDLIEKYQPKDILVIWWAWFSLPQYVAWLDFVQDIDVCDIDESMYDISEKYFLEEEINQKIDFFPMPARYMIFDQIKKWKKYDFIFVDAYNGKISIPSQLLTEEFYRSLEEISSGIIAFNFVMDKSKDSRFYKTTSNTMIKSLGNEIYIKDMNPKQDSTYTNFIILNNTEDNYNKMETYSKYPIYKDNQSRADLDKYLLFFENK